MPRRTHPDHPCPAARLPKVKLARIELVRPMDVATVHVDRAVTVEKEHAVRHDHLQSCRHPARRIYLHRLRKLRSMCIWVRSAKSPALVVFLPSLQLYGGHRRSAHRRARGHRRRDNALKLREIPNGSLPAGRRVHVAIQLHPLR